MPRSRFRRLDRRARWGAIAGAVVLAAACGDPSSPAEGGEGDGAALRVINGDVVPMAVLVDGRTVVAQLLPGTISSTLRVAPGARRVELRGATDGVATVDVAATRNDTLTVTAQRQGSGRTTAAVLADTGRIVPAGASKLRVVHMAPNAPPLDVWRTQPDFATPITLMFPFPYGASSSYVQSTPGTWEVRVSRGSGAPDGRPVSGGWDAALARMPIAVPAGQLRTLVILDGPNGTVRLAVLE